MNIEPICKGNIIRFMNLFTTTWQIYKTHFVPILVLSIIGTLPSLYSHCFVSGTTSPTFSFISFVIGEILGLLSYMSIICITDDVVGGRITSVIPVLKKALVRLPIAFSTKMLSYIMLFAWFLLIIVPGIYKSVQYIFTTQAVVLRDAAHVKAIDYSIRTVEGFWWTVVLIGLFVGLPGLIISLPFILNKGAFALANDQGFACSMIAIQILITGFCNVGYTLLFLALERIKTNNVEEVIKIN